mmetsp:Transcript_34734/g.73929  ORF Transcript_34734/g.73929 Transcript_34734/m.73929 type:complete len:159 (-) Transcript_34734:313-789(-)
MTTIPETIKVSMALESGKPGPGQVLTKGGPNAKEGLPTLLACEVAEGSDTASTGPTGSMKSPIFAHDVDGKATWRSVSAAAAEAANQAAAAAGVLAAPVSPPFRLNVQARRNHKRTKRGIEPQKRGKGYLHLSLAIATGFAVGMAATLTLASIKPRRG